MIISKGPPTVEHSMQAIYIHVTNFLTIKSAFIGFAVLTESKLSLANAIEQEITFEKILVADNAILS